MKKFKKIYKSLAFKKALINKELDGKNKDYAFFNKINWLKKGFTTESVIMYQLNKKKYKDFVSDYEQMLTGTINGDHSYVLNNKVVFELVNKKYITIPKTIAIVSSGKININEGNQTDIENLIKYLELNNISTVIVKPINDSRGNGIFKLELKDQVILLNDAEITIKKLNNIIKKLDQYYFSEYIEQSDFANQLYPHTINSIRILTMIDPVTNDPFIVSAVQRIGTNNSIPTDNFHRGGLSANIELDTGLINKAASIPTEGKLKWHSVHPETKNKIQGSVIPNWGDINDQIINLAQKNSNLKYVGWDIVLTDEGISVLEGNSWPDVNVFQIHNPLLINGKVRRFYKFHNIIK